MKTPNSEDDETSRQTASINNHGPADSMPDLESLLGDVECEEPWIAEAVIRLKADAPDREGTPAWSPGSVLGQRYELRDKLGSGGFGSVFLARDLSLARDVAIKLLHPGYSAIPRYRQRFEREARLAARVRHENVVAVYTVERADEETIYIVMERVDCRELRGGSEGLNDPAEIARLVLQAARGLDAAHQVGIIHRDIKCSNLLVDRNGHVRVSDFGLAFALAGEAHAGSLTEQMAGSLPYMSPEQISSPGSVDVRSDVYSLGVVLFELLAGSRPFQGTPAALMKQIVETDPPLLSQLDPRCPTDLVTIADKCLRKEPHQRYPTAAALADDLQRYLDGRPITARPTLPAERLARWCRRNPLPATLTGALAAALLSGTLVSLAFALQSRRDARIARREADTTAAVQRFLNEDLLPGSTSDVVDPDVPLQQLLFRAADNLEARFPDNPEVKATVHGILGRSFLSLGMLKDAEPQLLGAQKLLATSRGEANPETLAVMHDLGHLYRQMGDTEAARHWFSQSLATASRHLGQEHEQARLSAQALESVRELNLPDRLALLVKLCRTRLPADTQLAIDHLAPLAEQPDRFDALPRASRDALNVIAASMHAELVQRAPSPSRILRAAGRLLVELEEFEPAAQLFTTVLEQNRRLLSETHPRTLQARRDLAELYQRWGQLDRAAEQWKAYILVKAPSTDPRGLPHALAQHAYCSIMLEQYGQARASASMLRDVVKHVHLPKWFTFYVMTLLGMSVLGQQQPDQAAPDQAPPDQAAPLLELGFAAFHQRESLPPDYRSHLVQLLQRIPALYRKVHNEPQTQLWEQRAAEVAQAVDADFGTAIAAP